MIVSFGPQDAPRSAPAVASTWTGPPPEGVFFSFPSAKNPTQRLSGDQNGDPGDSVPGIRWAVTSSISRIQSMDRPADVDAMKTIARPSGDIANWGVETEALCGPEKIVP